MNSHEDKVPIFRIQLNQKSYLIQYLYQHQKYPYRQMCESSQILWNIHKIFAKEITITLYPKTFVNQPSRVGITLHIEAGRIMTSEFGTIIYILRKSMYVL